MLIDKLLVQRQKYKTCLHFSTSSSARGYTATATKDTLGSSVVNVTATGKTINNIQKHSYAYKNSENNILMVESLVNN